jgi:hypothetical protein
VVFGFSNVTLEFNNLQNNEHYNLGLNSIYNNANDPSKMSTKDLNATYNWWGATDPYDIFRTIHDSQKSPLLGTVTFIPFLNETNSEAPVPNSVTETQPATEEEPEPETEPETQPKATQLSIAADAPSEAGSAVNVKGTLVDVNGDPVANKTIYVSYSVSDDNWTFIDSNTTDSVGQYAIQWNNTEQGAYTLKAEWLGDETYLEANATTTFSVLPHENQTLFYIESNSTVTALEFDGIEPRLSFTVSGPNGTRGYITATIPKTLLDTEAEWTVFVDDEPIFPTIIEDPYKTVLHFDYSHSTHTITIVQNKQNQTFPTWTLLTLALVATAVLVSVYLTKLRKKPRQATLQDY